MKKLADREEIIQSAPESDREILAQYAPIVGLEKLAKDITDGKPIPEKAESQLKEMASQAAAQKQYNVLAGFSERTRKLGAQLASVVQSEKISKDELNVGAAKLIEERTKAVKNKFGPDYEDKIVQGVGKAIKLMLDSGDRKKQEAAVSALYFAEKGYSLGERDFAEEFS